MASTYTDIGTELMTTGENAGNWGTKTNTNIQILEEAIRGYSTQALTSGGTVALTYSDGSTGDTARNSVIALTGSLTGNAVVTVTAKEKWWIIDNQSTGAYTVQVLVSGQTGVTWATTDKGTKILYCNGTDVVDTGISSNILTSGTGDITLDSAADIVIDAAGGNVEFKDAGTTQLTLDMDGTAGAQVLKLGVDSDDLVFQQYDGTEVLRIEDNASLQIGTTGGLNIANSSNDMVIKPMTDAKDVIFQQYDGTEVARVEDGVQFNVSATTASSSATTGALITGGGLGVAADAYVGDDVYLISDSAVLGFGADSEIKFTHVADTGLTLKHTATADDKPIVLTLQTGETDIAADDIIGKVDFQAPDEAQGTDAILVAAGIEAVSEGDFSSSNNATKLSFKTAASEAAAEKMKLSSTGVLTLNGSSGSLVIPDAGNIGSASDTDAIAISSAGVVSLSATTEASATGTAALTLAGGLGVAKDVWIGDDLVLDSDSAVLKFGDDQEITLTHDADVGLKLKHTATADDKPIVLTLQTGETDMAANDVMGAIRFQAPDEAQGTDAILVAAAIQAVAEGDFSSSNNATTLEFHTGASEAASSKMTLSSAGLLTVTDDLVIKSGGTIGGAGDTDLLTLGSAILTVAGEVQMTTLDIGGTNVTSTATELNKLDGVGTLAQAGKQTIWVPSNAMNPTASNPCADIASVETTSGRPDLRVLDFDKDSDEHAQFSVAFPKSWDLGTVTFQVFWSGTANTGGVSWGLQGVACGDNDTIDVAYGTAIVVDDAEQGAVEEVNVSAESGAVTIAGSPADDQLCFFRIFRDVSDSNDDSSGDARLHGIKLFYTTDAANDD